MPVDTAKGQQHTAEFRAINPNGKVPAIVDTDGPGGAETQNEHIWPTAWADIIQGGMTPQAAAEKAFKRVEEIFTKYPITQS